MMDFFNDFYQFLFFASLFNIVQVIIVFFAKYYARTVENKDAVFQMSKLEKYLFFLSIALIFSYLF
jgi:hypothetical protein